MGVFGGVVVVALGWVVLAVVSYTAMGLHVWVMRD